MNRVLVILSALLLLQLPPSAHGEAPTGSIYLDGKESAYALILCHGRGKHPAWKVVDPLSKGVHNKLRWHTLSLQMPADKKDWKEYADDFPAAYKTLREAIAFLADEKGVTTIFLIGHSMGSRMASAFVADNPKQPIAGLIVAGIRNNGGYPLDGKKNLRRVKIPILDIWGAGGNGKDSRHAADREPLVSLSYTQIGIPGANHKFEGREDAFISAVVIWLKSQLSAIPVNYLK